MYGFVFLAALAGSLPFLSSPGFGAAASCDTVSSGISVPAGFCIEVYAKDVGALRHLAVANDGTVYAALSRPEQGGGIAMLRDTNADGQAEILRYFGEVRGTGIRLHDGFLYFAENARIVRFALSRKSGLPVDTPQNVVSGFPEQHQHASKSMAFDGEGHLYVSVGAPSNACQKHDRHPQSVGMDPCRLLERHGGIWRFSATKPGQSFSADARYATGLRNVVALTWNKNLHALFGVMMGRDQLHGNWPALYSVEENARLPAEEFLRIEQGDNFGWPYCYYDARQGKLVRAPEYGGDGTQVGRCKNFEQPLLAFPAHWSPEALVFYAAKAFPTKFRGGAFIAFHGSWNRAPQPQQGFVVAFVPFEHGEPSGQWRVFAKGFAGAEDLSSPEQARYRPVGLAVGPNGALYIADSQRGWIWRVTWQGKAGN